MAKKLVKIIYNCGSCDYCKHVIGLNYKTAKWKCRLKNKRLKDLTLIPDWCPLPDEDKD